MSDAKLARFRQLGGFEVVVSIREGYGLTGVGSMPEGRRPAADRGVDRDRAVHLPIRVGMD